MDQKTKKFGFFRQIATAVAQPKKYERFLHLSTGRVIAFLFIFSLITTFVGYYLPFIASQVFGESYMDVIDEYVPDFTLKDDVLTLSEPVEYDDGHTLVIANSHIGAFTEEDLAAYTETYTSVYLFGETNMIFYTSGQSTIYNYADLSIEELDREGLRAYVPSMYMMMVVSGLMNLVLRVFWYLLSALLLMLLGWSMKGFWNMQLSFLDLFKLGVFSKVLYEGITAIMRMFRFAFPMDFFFGLAVGFIYMNLAVKQLRADGYESDSTPSGSKLFGGNAAPSSKGIYSRASMSTAGKNDNGEPKDTEE
ncbi:MAG: DUF1189 domain-containing protein [bacterium]|nr:DUF1189 domain-containing protein [bacterium]